MTVGGDGTNTPEEIADPSYSGYVPPETSAQQTTSEDEIETSTVNPTDVTTDTSTDATTAESITTKNQETTKASQDSTSVSQDTTSASEVITKSQIESTKQSSTTKKSSVIVSVGKTKVKKFVKKKSAKKAKVTLKKVA